MRFRSPPPRAPRYLGIVDLVFDASGALQSLRGAPVLLGGSNSSSPVAGNTTVQALVDQLKPPVDAYANKVLGVWKA